MSAAAATAENPLARGVVVEASPTAIVLEIPHTEYRLSLLLAGPIGAATAVGRTVVGRIDVSARRIDVCRTGGCFIEPVYGEPRIVQGRVVAVDEGARRIVVQAGVPVYARVRPPQSARDFAVGQVVNFGVDSGAMFTPQSSGATAVGGGAAATAAASAHPGAAKSV